MATKTQPKSDVTKGELMRIRRLITEAGRLQDSLDPEVERLGRMKDEIKDFVTMMAAGPSSPAVVVSGEYVAEVSAERRERAGGPEVNRALMHLVGVEAMLGLVKLDTTATGKVIGTGKLDEIAPQKYTGKGRSLKIVNRG